MEIAGQRILNMLFYTEVDLVGYVRMVMEFDGCFVEVTVDSNTDELIVKTIGVDEVGKPTEFIRTEDDFTSEILQRTKGKSVGSYWLSANDKGYSDLFAIGVDEVVPSMIISCMASRLEVRWAYGV
jgi:hypothetical protein